MKRVVKFLLGADLWCSRLGVMTAVSLLSLLWFVADWCSSTTFRSMSDWLLWINNVLAALILTIPFLISRRVWVQTLWLLLVDLLLLADLMYCRTYFTSIPLESFALVGNLADFTASIYTSLKWIDLGFPIILGVGAFLAYRTKRENLSRPVVRYLSNISLLAVIAIAGILARGGFYSSYDRLVQSCYYSTCGTPTYTFAGHVVYSLIDAGQSSKDESFDEYDSWLSEHDKLMCSPALPDSVERRKNLVVIICESLESWVINSKMSGDRSITPYLDSLVADSTTFFAPKMLTQVASGRSIDCQLLLNAGMLPMTGSVYSMKFPASTYLTLNKALKEKYGSRSIIFTCDKPITWNQEVISRSFGYDTLIDRRGWEIDELVGNPGKLSDGSFLRQSVEKLRDENIWTEGDPIMLTFVTYSGHSPFRLPDNMKDESFDISADPLPEKLVDYITMAHYTDSKLHLLVDYLKSRSDWNETMVLIIGDHEGLASWRQELRNYSPEASRLVDKEQFTPFIVLNSPISGTYDGVMGQIDMYPTLINLLGLDDYQWKGLGQSIFAPGYSGVAVSMMTNEIVGYTTGVDDNVMAHIKKARSVSDGMIRRDYLRDFNR